MRKQKEKKLELNSYKGKYVTLKDIHANIKDKVKVQGAWVKKKNDYRDRELTYKEYYGIISKYFDKSECTLSTLPLACGLYIGVADHFILFFLQNQLFDVFLF